MVMKTIERLEPCLGGHRCLCLVKVVQALGQGVAKHLTDRRRPQQATSRTELVKVLRTRGRMELCLTQAREPQLQTRRRAIRIIRFRLISRSYSKVSIPHEILFLAKSRELICSSMLADSRKPQVKELSSNKSIPTCKDTAKLTRHKVALCKTVLLREASCKSSE